MQHMAQQARAQRHSAVATSQNPGTLRKRNEEPLRAAWNPKRIQARSNATCPPTRVARTQPGSS